MFPVLHIGSAAIQVPGLLLILGIFLGVAFSERFSRMRGENPDTLTNLVFIAGLSGLAMARLTFVMSHITLFKGNLASLFSIDASLLDPWGGLAGTSIAALIFGQRKQLKFWSTLDNLTPFLAVMAIFIGLAHIASGRAFGSSTSLPWAIDLWGAKRHPSQFYETIGASAILILLWKKYKSVGENGKIFLTFSALTSGLVVFLSAFRGDSRLILGDFRQEQILALIVLGLALLLLEIKSVSGKYDGKGK